jgi:hypothetical protein
MTRPRDEYYDYDEAYPRRNYDQERRRDHYDDYDRRSEPPRRHDRRPDRPTSRPPPQKKSSSLRSALDITVRIIILIFLLAFFTLPQFEAPRNQFLNYLEEGLYQYKDIPEYMIFNIERDMVIETSPDTEVPRFTLTIEKPFEFYDENDNKIQELQDLETIVPQGKGIAESMGNIQISWEGSVDAGDEVNIKVNYKIKSAHIIWDINTKTSGTLSDIPDSLRIQYSKDDWQVVDAFDNPRVNPYNMSAGTNFYRINPSDPDINALAHELVGDETNVYKILKIFYDFLDKGDGPSEYSEGSECEYPDQAQMDESRKTWNGMPKPARATLDDWVGDCDDQSFLYISLARAVGIPARVEAGGLWDSMISEWGGHGWAQVYIPRDDGTGLWATIDMVNNQFLERDPFRFTDFIDMGRVGVLEDYYTSWEYETRGGSNVIISEAYTDVGHTAIPSETIVHV